MDVDKGNIIQSVKMDKYKIMKQLPKNLNRTKGISKEEVDYSVSEESDVEAYKEALATPKPDFELPSSRDLSSGREREIAVERVDGASASESQSVPAAASSKGGGSSLALPGADGKGSQLSAYEHKALEVAGMLPAEEGGPTAAKRTRLVKRTVFFQGAAFIIEEEISVDSDEEESVKTSEDEFQVDDEGIKGQLHGFVNEQREEHKAEAANPKGGDLARLVQSLKQNEPLGHKNVFGRDEVYLVASFNEWQPIALQTTHEIKTKRSKGADLETWLAKLTDKTKLKSKKDSENVIQYTNYIPPGKHFFYYVFKNEYIFLSPSMTSPGSRAPTCS